MFLTRLLTASNFVEILLLVCQDAHTFCYVVFERLEFNYNQTARCKAIITKSEPKLK